MEAATCPPPPDQAWRVELGDCLDVLARMPAESVDAVITDPPYGLSGQPDMAEVLRHWLAGDDYAHRGGGFMSAAWDSFVPGPAVWSECLRVLKPGGHLLAFAGTRTADMLTTAIRLAGFEIRDRVLTLNGHVLGPELAWVYGAGWPKSRDISKAIAKRPDATPQEAAQWDGWGTALKPAHEPIVVARKSFRGTVEEQVRATGTGAINVNACRIDTGGETITAGLSDPANRRGVVGSKLQAPSDADRNQAAQRESLERANTLGRWPANLVLLHAPNCERVGTRQVQGDPREGGDGTRPAGFGDVGSSPGDDRPNARVYGDDEGLETVEVWECEPGCPVAELDALSGELRSGEPGVHRGHPNVSPAYGDRGGASRFFYSGKASSAEREFGLDDLPEGLGGGHLAQADGTRMGRSAEEGAGVRERPLVRNVHPTVKPIDLMRWLVRLVTPPGGVVLDPFTGSGSTGCAAALEGVEFLGIERSEEYAELARRRIAAWARFPPGTATERVLGVEAGRQRAADEAEERRRALASAGQLDLLAGGGLVE